MTFVLRDTVQGNMSIYASFKHLRSVSNAYHKALILQDKQAMTYTKERNFDERHSSDNTRKQDIASNKTKRRVIVVRMRKQEGGVAAITNSSVGSAESDRTILGQYKGKM